MVLWIRVGALGDLLVSLQALEETFKRFSDRPVYVVGPKLWLEILVPSQWKNLAGVVVLTGSQKGELYLRGEVDSQGNAEWVRQPGEKSLREFYRQAYACVNLRIESYRYAWGPFLARVPVRIGSSPTVMKWLYTDWYPWLGKEPPIHERDWYSEIVKSRDSHLSTLDKFSVVRTRKKLLGAVDVSQAKNFARPVGGLPTLKTPNVKKIEELTQSQAKFGRYWIINPTASRIEKAWPAENFARLADEIRADLQSHGMQLIILGAPNETDWLEKVSRHKHILVQPKSLRDLIDVVAGGRLLVTNTSSLQFVAATTKTPVLTLMGRSTPLRWGPVGNHDRVIQGQAPKNSSHDLFQEELAAYKSISVERVINEIRGRL
jgi:ADP-heptose:LPS heptosyltransferase